MAGTKWLATLLLLTGCSAPDSPASMPGEMSCSAIAEPNPWANWRMPNPSSSGLPNRAGYQLSESGQLVTDTVTGLTWQRDSDARSFTWAEAKQYCACWSADGSTGWRLPSRIELVSLVDWTASSPSLDARAFPGTPSENFWTSSAVTIDPGLGYLVFFLNGHTTYSDMDYAYRARCVRGSQPALPERYELASGSVLDTQTGLTWQQEVPPSRYSWPEAGDYCAHLTLDGAGWRLPSINELQTLVDDSRNPSIDGGAFPATPSEYFWSSSAVIDDATRAWTTFFTNGSTYSFATSATKNVRCVR